MARRDNNGQETENTSALRYVTQKAVERSSPKAEENAAELIAQLLKRARMGNRQSKKHQDFSGKTAHIGR